MSGGIVLFRLDADLGEVGQSEMRIHRARENNGMLALNKRVNAYRFAEGVFERLNRLLRIGRGETARERVGL